MAMKLVQILTCDASIGFNLPINHFRVAAVCLSGRSYEMGHRLPCSSLTCHPVDPGRPSSMETHRGLVSPFCSAEQHNRVPFWSHWLLTGGYGIVPEENGLKQQMQFQFSTSSTTLEMSIQKKVVRVEWSWNLSPVSLPHPSSMGSTTLTVFPVDLEVNRSFLG